MRTREAPVHTQLQLSTFRSSLHLLGQSLACTAAGNQSAEAGKQSTQPNRHTGLAEAGKNI
jgi:hypothetical protein